MLIWMKLVKTVKMLCSLLMKMYSLSLSLSHLR